MPINIEGQPVKPTNKGDLEVFEFLVDKIKQATGPLLDETIEPEEEDETPEDPSQNKEPVA